jgi:hypothetical protein
VEQQAPGVGAAAVEAEGEPVEVVVEMLALDAALTVVAFETLVSDAKVSTLQKLRWAFAEAGVILIEDGEASLDGRSGIAVEAGPQAVIARLKEWAPTVAKVLVAIWMAAVLYELHEIRRHAEHTSGDTSVSFYSLEQLRRRLAPTHRY